MLHVVDVSNRHAAEQAQVVDDVLEDMGLADKPRVLVLNKLDLVTDDPDTFDSRIPAQDGQAVTRGSAHFGPRRLGNKRTAAGDRRRVVPGDGFLAGGGGALI